MADYVHYDILGQEIKVGSIILHSDGGYNGQKAYLIKNLAKKMVTIMGGKSVYPSTVVVIDEIVNKMSDEQVLHLIKKTGRKGSFIIGGLKNPSEKVLIEAVKLNNDALVSIKDPAMQTLIKLVAGI